MKSIIISLGLLIFLLGNQQMHAQKGPKAFHGKRQIEMIKSVVDLSEEQEAEIEILQTQFKEDLAAIRNQQFEDQTARREAMKVLMLNHQAEVEAVLTEEQVATLKTAMQEKLEHRKAQLEQIDHKALKSELIAYRKANVLPLMLAQRAKLESEITPEDKALIEELRQEAKAQKAAWKEQKGEMKGKKGRKRGGKGKRGDHAKGKDDAFRTSMKNLVEKYEEQISALYEEVKPQQEQWEADQKEIFKKYMPEGHEKQAKAHKGKHKRGKKEFARKLKKAHFLLLDPNKEESAIELLGLEEKTSAEISVFPNPATDQNTIKYKIHEAGQITIELRTENGVLIQTVVNEYRDAGTYQEQVSLANLKDGVYYYTINDQNGVVTQKIVVSNNK